MFITWGALIVDFHDPDRKLWKQKAVASNREQKSQRSQYWFVLHLEALKPGSTLADFWGFRKGVISISDTDQSLVERGNRLVLSFSLLVYHMGKSEMKMSLMSKRIYFSHHRKFFHSLECTFWTRIVNLQSGWKKLSMPPCVTQARVSHAR